MSCDQVIISGVPFQIVPAAQEALAAVMHLASVVHMSPLAYEAETSNQEWGYGYQSYGPYTD